MNKTSILHRADSEMCYLTDDGQMVLVLKAARGDLAEVVLVYDDRYDAVPKREPRRLPLERYAADALYDYFRVEFKSPYTRLGYYFLLTDHAGERAYFYQDGFALQYSWGRQRLFQLPYLHAADTPHVPMWLKESVCYQIFPDSFAQGEGRIEPSPVQLETADGVKLESRLGGTLNGIRANVPYLRDLGVNLLYLNPIFVANSYHKYDTVDYFHIDPCLGTDEDFRQLVDTCHENGIRVMLDLVFNQTGSSFFAFRDVLEKQENSAYADWYALREFPVMGGEHPNYETFAFYDGMPKLRTETPAVEEHLLAVGRHWLREYGVDGYRLDVANEVSHAFWRKFRQEMEAIRPDIALIGEVWHEASAWIARDQFHSVMNFPLLYAMWGFFGQDSLHAQEFLDTLCQLSLQYKQDNVLGMMNFLDNHDVCRFYSIAGKSAARQKLAVTFLMAYAGMPLVYYGSEKALEGANADDGRRPMLWEDTPASKEMHDWYRRVIHMRRENSVLAHGGFRPAKADTTTNTVGFWRETAAERMLCLFHVGEQPAAYCLPDEGVYTDTLTGETFAGAATVPLAAYGARLLRRAERTVAE